MNIPKVLLAKSLGKLPRPEEARLVTHTTRVVESARILVDLLEGVIRPLPPWWPRLRQVTLAACLFHDLGKANSAFQNMLLRYPKPTDLQPIRHEILSFVLIVHEHYLAQWLEQALDTNVDVALAGCAAGGHHLKLSGGAASMVRAGGVGANHTFYFFGGHENVDALLRLAAKILKVSDPPTSLKDLSLSIVEDSESVSPEELLDSVIGHVRKTLSSISEEEKQLLAFAKALTVAADVAGSALPRKKETPRRWIPTALNKRLEPSHLDKIVTQKLGAKTKRPFQEKIAASSGPVTIAVAGCGNGKTLAGYMWARKHATGRKLFFCYPTTGTASAGYEDYLHAQSGLERTLIHGRAEVDLELMASTPDDDAYEENQRLESLRAWGQQAIVCTADTVLGLVQNQRRGLFSFPAIATGAFVFDEIHNYDKRMFGSLVRFLEVFPFAPALLMSASIPAKRVDYLREKLGDRVGEPIPGDPDLETAPRYVIRKRDNAEACWPDVERSIRERKQKVLWVCNTVRDARIIYRQAKKRRIFPVVLYHSRYRYCDRVARQKEVLRHFPKDRDDNPIFGDPVLVIATQVCEMSLDISAQLMVTALAPFPALIQRLGRLNRYVECPEGAECLIYPFDCPDDRPYKKEELDTSRQVLPQLYDRPLSQRDLADALSKLSLYEEIETDSAWLDGVGGVWESNQLPLREGDVSLTVLMQRDKNDIRRELAKKGKKPTAQTVAGWTIPMLFKKGIPYKSWEILGGYRVAPDEWIMYDDHEGAEWIKENQN